MTIQQIITYLEHNAYIIGEVTDACVEALKKQAGIERALERLKKKEEEYLKEFRTRGHEELYGASWGFEEAIDIITEEVG